MNNELDMLRGILEELSSVAERSSLTGSLDDGRAAATRRYNGVLRRLEAMQAVPEGLFSGLSDQAPMGEIAVEVRSLIGAIGSSRKANRDDGLRLAIKLAPFAEEKDLAHLIRSHLSSHARVDVDALTSLAPFVGSDTLGELIRAVSERREPSAAPPEPPTAPIPPQAPGDDAVVVSTRREEILRLLTNPHLGREQRLDLAMELTALESQGS